MAFQGIRRAFVGLASVTLLALAGCGSGTIESQLKPTRVVAFGDAFSDLGQVAGRRYTVNDGNINNWTFAVAFSYGVTLAPSSAGGTNYAYGNARVIAHPDAAGNAATPAVADQVTTFLGSSSLSSTDLVLIEGGYSDIIAETAAVNAGTQTSAQMLLNVAKAGRDLGAQVRRIVQAGGSHVVLTGTYDLGKGPWATSSSQAALLSAASSQFNQELLVSVVDLGSSVLYVDAQFLFNLMIASPSAYGLTNSASAVCTSVDPGPGIGIGANQVNSSLCTPATVPPGAVYNQYLFADLVYPTPQGQLKFADYAYARVRARF